MKAIPILIGLLVVGLAAFVSADGGTSSNGGPFTKDGTKEGLLALSHPDIYPEEEVHMGELEVHIVENARESDTYYTLDGSVPQPDINPAAIRYTSPLHFSQPGKVWIRARAVPSAFQLDGIHIPSQIVEQKYTIEATSISPPTATPRGGYYRGQVIIEAKAGTKGTDTTAVASDVQVKYLWKDANKQGEASVKPTDTWTVYSDDHIKMETVGKHFLFLQAVSKKDGKDKSPMSRFTYYVTAPLVYDVSTECSKCEGKATANEYFTVTIQNANAESWMFLSYSSRCDIGTKLMGTSRNPIDRHMPSAKFRVYESTPAVFVCLEEGGSAFAVVNRNSKEEDRRHFSVARPLREISAGEQKKAVEAANKQDAEQGGPMYDSNGVLIKRTNSSNTGGSMGFFFFFALVLGLFVYLVRASRHGNNMSNIHRAVVDDVQRLVGKKGANDQEMTQA